MRVPLDPLIVIHGVGSPQLGSLIHEVRSHILANSDPRPVECIHYPADFPIPVVHLTNDAEEIDVYEVNWADLARPDPGVVGVLLHFIRIQFAMLQLADVGWLPNEKPKVIGWALRRAIAAVAIWMPLLVTTVFFATVFKPWPAVLLVLATTSFSYIATRVFAGYDCWARAGYFWTVVGLVAGIAALFIPGSKSEILNLCFLTATVVETLCGILVVVGVSKTLLECRRGTGRRALVRCAFYILPFSLLFGGIGSFVIGTNLFIAHRAMGLGLLDSTYFESFRRFIEAPHTTNIAFLEVVNTSTTFVALLFLVVAIATWFVLLRMGAVDRSEWGKVFRRMVTAWLILLPILTAVVFIAFVVDVSGEVAYVENFKLSTIGAVDWVIRALLPKDVAAEPVLSPLDVYIYSALRLLPAFFWLIPKLREPVSIITDALFYELPSEFSLATAETTKARLAKCVRFAEAQGGGKPPAILAHSQGSRISYDAILEQQLPTKRLVTIGSPIDALYRDFLGRTHDGTTKLPAGTEWINMYRNSDYIAGRIEGANVANVPVHANFPKAHTGYFIEPEVIDVVLKGTSSIPSV